MTDRTLCRSADPATQPLRMIFGQHVFSAYVYRKRVHPHTPVVFRPIDVRMSLSPGRWSHLLEEFTQLFSIDEAYAPAAEAFERIFRQRLSVDTLEEVNCRMGQEAAEFLDRLGTPPAAEEGELLVVTSDGKGVPMVKADAVRLRASRSVPRGRGTAAWPRSPVCPRSTGTCARPSRSWRRCFGTCARSRPTSAPSHVTSG